MTKLKISSFSPVFTCLNIELTFTQFFTSTALMFFFHPTDTGATSSLEPWVTYIRSHAGVSRTTTIILYVPYSNSSCSMYHSSQNVSESEHVFSSKIIWFWANSPSSTNMIRKFQHFVVDETWSSLTKPYLFQVTINFRQWDALNSHLPQGVPQTQQQLLPNTLDLTIGGVNVTETKQPASLRQHSPTMNFWKLKRNKVLFEGYIFWLQVFALEDVWTETSVFFN